MAQDLMAHGIPIPVTLDAQKQHEKICDGHGILHDHALHRKLICLEYHCI